MKKILFLTFSMLLLFICYAFANGDKTQGEFMNDKKVLIAYFSWSGNTQHIAENIKDVTGGDLFRIETKAPYPDDYQETAYGIAKKQHEENTKPELKDNGDVSDYDIIFIGTPVWWHELAPAVKTFITENNFKGKTIIPFISHGGGGKYSIPEDMATLAKDSKALKPLIVSGKGGSDLQNDIKNWVKEIKEEIQ